MYFVCQIGHTSFAGIAPRQVGIDFQEFAVANDDSSVPADAVVDGVEQPTST